MGKKKVLEAIVDAAIVLMYELGNMSMLYYYSKFLDVIWSVINKFLLFFFLYFFFIAKLADHSRR